MSKSALPLLAAGGAALLLLGGKKKKRKSSGTSIVFDDGENVAGGDLDQAPPATSEGVTFSPNLNAYEIGATWRIRKLDAYLDDRRREGLLTTVDHDAGWLYSLLVDDPTTWLGDITGLGKTGGTVIYGALWIMATVGVGVYATGFAAAGSNITAATQAASTTRAAQILGPEAMSLASRLYSQGFGSSQIALALKDLGGMTNLARFGIGKSFAMLSGGAAGMGGSMATGVLAEAGIDSAFAPDLAASAVEAAADFSRSYHVNVAGMMVPIALLPSSDEYPAVQEFNKLIMNYIVGFQKRHFYT